MASSDNISMAVFCDFENVALGVRDANYEKFDIKPILERLLLKGSIVVKKAYCDWDRYKGFKATMHEANFELIEIPHVRQSGKNSADIRLVVDALDLCYTKSHVNTFVIVSGDSDFSPLVSKLRENAKRVIGVGVKQSTSDLLVANCDEFIFYDDLVREQRRAAAKRDERKAQPQAQAQGGRRPSDENNRKREDQETRKLQALEMVVETFDALVTERGDTGKIWASLLKDTLKRRRPDFSETYFGFRTFGNLLEDAEKRGLFEMGRDEKSGTYVYRGANAQSLETLTAGSDGEQAVAVAELSVPDAPDAVETPDVEEAAPTPAAPPAGAREPRRRGGRGRKGREQYGTAPVAQADGAAEVGAIADSDADADADATGDLLVAESAAPAHAPDGAGLATWPAPTPDLVEAGPSEPDADAVAASVADDQVASEPAPVPVKERRRAPRKPAARRGSQAPVEQADAGAAAVDTAAAAVRPDESAPAEAPVPAPEAADVAPPASTADADAPPADAASEETGDGAQSERKKSARPAHKAPSRKPAARSRRPAKPKTPENG